VTIPDSVSSIGDGAFQGCTALTSVYFSGNPPISGLYAFHYFPTLYYLPGTTGWTSTYGGLPTAPWLPDVRQTGRNAAGDFTLSAFWASGQTVRIEAATRLMNPDWTAIHTTAIPPSGTLEFTDPSSASHPARFYRIVGL
jgi:hypothetical protein